MPYLSRDQIEQIADGIIRQYKTALVPEKHLFYNVDPNVSDCQSKHNL